MLVSPLMIGLEEVRPMMHRWLIAKLDRQNVHEYHDMVICQRMAICVIVISAIFISNPVNKIFPNYSYKKHGPFAFTKHLRNYFAVFASRVLNYPH